MTAKIVIGANFGDEGKGHITDFLATPDSIVVRFSGGANAGHTVQVGDTRRVFHHFGSGTLRGARTFLSEHFVVNPFLWVKEDAPPQKVWMHCDAKLTIPADMLVNQYAERIRGGSRHGSCGVGINETVTRSLAAVGPTLRDLVARPFHEIRHRIEEAIPYAIERMLPHDDTALRDRFLDRLHDRDILQGYLRACRRMLYGAEIVDNYEPLLGAPVVFEGSQGLLLDQGHHWFPHVTRANTGRRNAVEIATQLGLDYELIYVTRTYMTRHGNGPFPSEDQTLQYEDLTNQPNEWQGQLRFGTLSVPLLAGTVHADAGAHPDVCLALNHLDQCYLDPTTLERAVGYPVRYISHGPDRNDIQYRHHGV